MERVATRIVLSIVVLLVCILPAHAASNPAIEALETLRQGFAKTHDFTADITQEKQLALMKRKMVSTGVVRFRKPDTFYMEIYPPHASKLLLKDNVMTIRLVEQGETKKIVLSPEQGLNKWLTYLSKPVTTLPEGADIRAERQGKLWNMQVVPKAQGNVEKLTITFDQEGKIKKLVVDEHNKDRTTLLFNNLRRNAGLRDFDFRIE